MVSVQARKSAPPKPLPYNPRGQLSFSHVSENYQDKSAGSFSHILYSVEENISALHQPAIYAEVGIIIPLVSIIII